MEAKFGGSNSPEQPPPIMPVSTKMESSKSLDCMCIARSFTGMLSKQRFSVDQRVVKAGACVSVCVCKSR